MSLAVAHPLLLLKLIRERQGKLQAPYKSKETKKSSVGTDPPAAKVRSRAAGQAGSCSVGLAEKAPSRWSGKLVTVLREL